MWTNFRLQLVCPLWCILPVDTSTLHQLLWRYDNSQHRYNIGHKVVSQRRDKREACRPTHRLKIRDPAESTTFLQMFFEGCTIGHGGILFLWHLRYRIYVMLCWADLVVVTGHSSRLANCGTAQVLDIQNRQGSRGCEKCKNRLEQGWWLCIYISAVS